MTFTYHAQVGPKISIETRKQPIQFDRLSSIISVLNNYLTFDPRFSARTMIMPNKLLIKKTICIFLT